MVDPQEHALVVRAFDLSVGPRGYVGGFVEWDGDQEMIAARADLGGLTPKAIRRMTIDFVRDGGRIDQRVEERENHLDFAFYYRVIVPAEGFPRGIFVELRLVDDDPGAPVVHIVSAHRQGV
ncbi:MAG: hypothetical protein ACP5XB_08160 [Isosphaeraceae bacterium]